MNWDAWSHGKSIDGADLTIRTLGDCAFDSPLRLTSTRDDGWGDFVSEESRIQYQIETHPKAPCRNDVAFEKAGPRERLFFDPKKTRLAIVTCGGLCPGLNIVIRSFFLELHYHYEVKEVLDRYGYAGNLFIYTRPYEESYARSLPWDVEYEHMTWDEIGELKQAGWHIGAHTVSHPNLSDLSLEDPAGEILRMELDRCNETIQKNLGFVPRDFAFTGTSWSSLAEQEVKKRYRFGRLWIIGSEYSVDGEPVRYADLVDVAGPDEADGGPPHAARYITRDSDPYRLPSMEIQALIHEPDAFRSYLEGSLE